jgi:hypothetical protein
MSSGKVARTSKGSCTTRVQGLNRPSHDLVRPRNRFCFSRILEHEITTPRDDLCLVIQTVIADQPGQPSPVRSEVGPFQALARVGFSLGSQLVGMHWEGRISEATAFCSRLVAEVVTCDSVLSPK